MKPLHIFRIVLVVLAAAAGIYRGCNRDSSSNRKVTESGETAYMRPVDDPALEAAAKLAREKWPEFVNALSLRQPDLSFSVKVPLATKAGSTEHIWVSVDSVDGNTIRGTLANDPFEDIGYKNGDPISVQADIIEDWIINKRGKLIQGGFSLEILRNTK